MQQELEAARRAQQAAAEEATRLRAEAEARRKADEEAALRRKIEDELRQKAEAAKAEAEKAEAAKADVAKAEADRARAEAQKKPPSQMASSSAPGATQCEGTWRSLWCRGAFQGFPESCWHVPMTIRNGAISGQWTSQGATEPQTFSGQVSPDGTVNLVYNGIGQQTFTGQHFTVNMTGSVSGGALNAKGRAGTNGRDFSVTVQCR
jgi:hypothetical protein